ncbi:hypothetical protein ACFE04_009154 [Oxalis oulophora]
MNKEVMIDKTNRTIRTVRLPAPLHFIWKIESYSTLLESKWEKVESGTFEVDGRKWKLTFYPNGDLHHEGEGYISLYLSLLDTEELPLCSDLFLKFQFLVYDQVNYKYLVIQDVHEVCRFQRMKTEWGFAQLLPLGVFKKPSNGYLFDDSCIFGVDIFVVKGATRGDTLSVVKPPTSDKSYSFKIKKFSFIDKAVYSDVFTINDMKWKLAIYPKGSDQKAKDNVSLYLRLDSKLPDHNSKVYVKYKLRLIDQVHAKHLERKVDYGFHNKLGFGYPRFALQKDVHDASKGYLVKDTIIVEVEIDYLSIVKHFS